jgi:hypothetical protein
MIEAERRSSSRYCVVLHTPAYVSIRQHTSAYISIRQHRGGAQQQQPLLRRLAYVSIRQHTSAYVSKGYRVDLSREVSGHDSAAVHDVDPALAR